jgi:hypothetical protein
MKTITKHLFILLSLVAAFLFCSRESNPFSNYANAGLYIVHQSIRDNDTLDIFSTESLQIRVTVKELVGRFSVSATANRLWPSPESTVVSSEFSKEPFTFFISFYDTGWQSVVTSVYKTNGQQITESLHVYLKSPLHQDSLVAFEHDSVTLHTTHVKDRDVIYYWALGASVLYASPLCSTRVSVAAPSYAGKGSLWVWDGRHVSPADSFSFSLRDTVKPTIACVNTEQMQGDTIFTSDSIFAFKARITDDLTGSVDSASVNGRAFDGKNGSEYYKLFDKVYAHPSGNPLALAVYALDHFRNGNTAEKTYWLVFSTSVPHAKKARIVVLTPPFDTSTVSSASYILSGRIENNSLDSLNLSLRLYVNDTVNPVVRTITNAATTWDWTVALNPGPNTARLIAADQSGTVIDWKDLLLFFTPGGPDTMPPRILDVLADGKVAQGLYTDKSSVVIAVRAIDEGSGIDTLFINGVAAAPHGLWYYDTLQLSHVTSGNEVVITAVDKKKNRTQQAVVLFKNSLPVVQKSPRSAFIEADSAYTDTIHAIDPDNDTLSYQRTEGPAGLVVGQNGVITWVPAESDTGARTVTIRVWDGYQPVFATFMLYVSLPGHLPPKPVSFAIRAEDFPLFLTAGKDTLKKVLTVAHGTGIPPFVFSARVVGKKPLLLDNTSDSLLVWAPGVGDTGYCQIIAIVKDEFPSTDTLYSRILVVPPNRPCSISVSYVADTLANGAVDLTGMLTPFTMVFRIHDPDNPLSERHSVTLFDAHTHATSAIDSAVVDTFLYTVDPTVFYGYDTIVASVRDQSSADTIRVRLYFGFSLGIPVTLSPLNNAVINQSSVALSFSCSNPDSDSLSFDVYFGTNPLSLSRVGPIAATSITLYGLISNTTYYWKVVAHSSKSQTESQLWQFTTGQVN